MLAKGRASNLRGVGDDPVSAFSLCGVKRLIRPFEKCSRGVTGPREGRYADAGGDPELGFGVDLERLGGDASAQALADLECPPDVGFRHDDHEFFAAQAASEVDATCVSAKACGKLTQNGVAGIVAVGVVNLLEEINVGDEHG